MGLIVVVIAAGLIYFFAYRQTQYRVNRDYDSNVNLNTNSNSNSDSDSNLNSNPSDASMSADDKHKLFYAATVTGDAELIRRVNVKLGLLNDDFTPGEKMQDFMLDHAAWAFRNTDFIAEINSADKARTYVNENFPE